MTKHVLQTSSWAKVREEQGSAVEWFDEQHLIVYKTAPKPFKSIGILSQVDAAQLNLEALYALGKRRGLSHLQIDPNERRTDFDFSAEQKKQFKLIPTESLLLRHTVLINLEQSDDELLNQMQKNWRYNCKYALKQGLEVEFRTDAEAIEEFLEVFFLTVQAKGFLGRNRQYYRQVWQIMREDNKAVIVLGKLNSKTVVARMLFLHQGVIYTAYTGTSRESSVGKSKAAYGVMWKIMQWGKENGYREINMWGVEPNAAQNHPHFGFTQFKMGFGGELVELAPAYDLVIDLGAYRAFKFANFMRIALLRLKNRLFASA